MSFLSTVNQGLVGVDTSPYLGTVVSLEQYEACFVLMPIHPLMCDISDSSMISSRQVTRISG